MRVLLEPNDVLMFRESKPYTAGEAHLARSTLPLPQAVTGALRSAILLKSNFSDDVKEFVGCGKDEPEFEILGYFLFRNEELFPTPLDIAKAKGVDGYFFVRPMKWGGKFIFSGKSIHFKSVGGYLSLGDFVRYLKGGLKEDELEDVVENELIKRDSRVGIKLGDGKVTEETYFYKVEFLSFNDTGISVWLGENGKRVRELLGESGLLKLGGEGRFARFRFEDSNPLHIFEDAWGDIRDEIKRCFKLYVATPLLIKSEDKFTWDVKHSLSRLGIAVESIYPLVGNPISFSGWDYAKKKPKPTRYAVPAGSVYFVEFEGELNLDRPYVKLGELTKLGYGLCFVGVW